jgi:hypothetical protein
VQQGAITFIIYKIKGVKESSLTRVMASKKDLFVNMINLSVCPPVCMRLSMSV